MTKNDKKMTKTTTKRRREEGKKDLSALPAKTETMEGEYLFLKKGRRELKTQTSRPDQRG